MDKHMISSRVDDAMPAILDELKEFVAIESISASSFDQNTLKESAAWIASRVEKLGLDTEVIQIETEDGLVGRPAILASRPAEPGKPTVLLYAHHDVQPVGELSEWDSEPFDAVERDGRLYGRGTADDKAGVLVHLAAIEAAEPGVGIRLFIEGEEEVGSPTFVAFLEKYRERLEADVIVVADSSNWKVGVPALTTSLRGVVQLEVSIKVLDHALHSGFFGGPVLDAVVVASRLISTLHDDAGNVAVAGLLQEDSTQVDYPEDDFRRDAGVLDGVQLAGSGSFTSRLWTKPAISVIGMDVTPVAISSNTIIPSVDLAISMRVAPGQDSREAAELLAQHLRDHVPFGAQIEVTIAEAGSAFSAGEDTEATEMARWALKEAWGVDPVDIGQGGSIPFIADLAKAFPRAQILVTGIEDPDTRAHSANESLHIEDFRNAIVAQALLMSRLAE
ncbi:Succinyl-diaminopimelate desuccinylase [Arcanobacterium haemolyticum]|uniref:Peptidase M20 n=2 Tax=Arcanobacterium haemolyticum TaxID=28264 RepID=D7BNH7_ARCHD|nr:peptidase M20 [Arcanobacterium haemolyticum DSM 20595]SPT75434.1 Succinyl-diaminopimelate desuccinylase [Arcanobacterium haemolyticum]SQH28794.1 Succinyl-diaminopimelate desuccinylase [Arcanobacterium haemolyticum]